MKQFSLSLVLFGLTLSIATAAQAQQLSEAVVDERLTFLENRLDADKKHGMYWQYGWFAPPTYGLVHGTRWAAKYNSSKNRAGSIVEATQGAIGIGFLLLQPMQARYGADRIRAMPSSTLAQKQNQLLAAEQQLDRNAKRAAQRTSWKSYAGVAGFAAFTSAFIVGFGHLGDAGINFASSTAVGSLQFYTQPKRAVQDQKDYQALVNRTAQTGTPRNWSLTPTPTGIAFNMQF